MENNKSDLLNKLKKISGYQPRKERVKQGNLVVEIDSDGYLFATSYGHWTFISNVDGVYLFNWYTYSVSTSKHQRVT